MDEAPDGWSGPIALFRGDETGMVPSCEFPYAIRDAELSADLDIPDATCGCECTPPSDVACEGGAVVYNATSSDCTTPSTVYPFASNGCVDFGGEFFNIRFWAFDASTVAITGSECLPDPTEVIPGAEHTSVVLACGGVEDDGDCGNTQLCVPNPEAPFSSAPCIFAEGDMECPAGTEYTERSVFYESFTDDRTCSACTCGDVDGTCTNLTATMRDDANCAGAAGSVLTEAAPCQDGGPVSPQSAELDATANPTCMASGGDPEGGVTETGPHTFCCIG